MWSVISEGTSGCIFLVGGGGGVYPAEWGKFKLFELQGEPPSPIPSISETSLYTNKENR